MDLECLARRCLDPFPVYVADVLLQERRVFKLERITRQLQKVEQWVEAAIPHLWGHCGGEARSRAASHW